MSSTTNVNAVAIMATGLTFVAALQWSNAFEALLDKWIPDNKTKNLWARFLSAFLFTFFVVLLLIFVVHLTSKISPKYRQFALPSIKID